MIRDDRSYFLDLARGLFLVYSLAWVYLVFVCAPKLDDQQIIEIFQNALVISLFVGLALNVNAFRPHARKNGYRALSHILRYLREHLGHVLAFYFIPFAVSSASGLVAASHDDLLQLLFGTESYALICAGGFVVFILLPAIFILYRHGWK